GDVEELLYTMLRKQNQISSPHIDYSIFVKGVQGRRLVYPVFKHHDDKAETDVVAVAREAELKVDIHNKLVLVHMRFGETLSRGGGGTNSLFDDHVFDVPLPEGILNNTIPRARDMTWKQLLQEHKREEMEAAQLAADIAALDPEIESGTATDAKK